MLSLDLESNAVQEEVLLALREKAPLRGRELEWRQCAYGMQLASVAYLEGKVEALDLPEFEWKALSVLLGVLGAALTVLNKLLYQWMSNYAKGPQ